MSEEMKACPVCKSPYGYSMGQNLYACPECGHEWDPDLVIDENVIIAKDANGNLLSDGDAVIVVKDLNVKGASGAIKAGTKVKNIRITEGDARGEHNIDCRVDGFGAMALTSKFVRKAQTS